MASQPAEDYLRSDRIYDYEEFQHIQSRYGGAAPRASRLLNFVARKRRFEFVLNYPNLLRIGIVLLILTVAAYALLSTGVFRKRYALMETRQTLSNLETTMTQQLQANGQRRQALTHRQQMAAALGLTAVMSPTYIVRTNILPREPAARTVDELYPLANQLITVEP
ncbi:MAG: hypothetical protein B1H03_05185 [Planctomycetales bacterium 4484_113]|nr:MAG: hypothetical protein B1H03_05185 [Planctomycetales bacterium 4484_113]